MALDRLIYFDDPPTVERIGEELKAYFGGLGIMNFGLDRYFILLPGDDPAHRYGSANRWIEVWRGADCIDVITRQQDNFTNAVAEGLAGRLRRKFNGRTEARPTLDDPPPQSTTGPVETPIERATRHVTPEKPE